MLERCIARHKPDPKRDGSDGDVGLRAVRAALDFMQISMKVGAWSYAVLETVLDCSKCIGLTIVQVTGDRGVPVDLKCDLN
jgi:hypothetical protein